MSDIDLANRALAEVKARSTITSFDEPSAEAVYCKMFYDPMRKALLRSAHWGMARQQQQLSLLGSLDQGTSDYPWLYKYEYPPNCLKVRYLLQNPQAPNNSLATPIPGTFSGTWQGPSRKNRFLIGSEGIGADARRIILSNVPSAIAVITADVTNTDVFDDLFAEAFVQMLASKLVIPVSGDVAMKGQKEQEVKTKVDQARAVDGNEALPTTDHTADWIKARNIGSWPSGVDGFDGLGIWYNGWDQLPWGE